MAKEKTSKLSKSVSKAKTSAKKTPTKEVIQEEVVEVVEKPVKKKRIIERDEVVACRNLTSGKLIYISKKTGLETVWSVYGDEEYLEVGELLTMRSSQPKFLKNPWLLIDDEEVVEYLGLKSIYDTILPVDELDSLFDLTVNEVRNILPKLPKGLRDLLAEKARQGIQDGTLNNLQVIRLLEQELKLDLLSLME
jgi:hypothetical protein